MARPKLENSEAVVVTTTRHDGVKLTSVGVRFARKIQTAPFESADAEVSIWADIEGENDEKLDATFRRLWVVARDQVRFGLLTAGAKPAQAAMPMPPEQSTAAAPSAAVVIPEPMVVTPEARVVRPRTHPAVAFGRPTLTAGITSETLGRLIDVCTQFDRLTKTGAAAEVLAEFCPEAFAIKDGKRVFTRVALTEDEGVRLIAHLLPVVETTTKGTIEEAL